MSLYGRSVYGRCVTLEDMIYQMKYKIIYVHLRSIVTACTLRGNYGRSENCPFSNLCQKTTNIYLCVIILLICVNRRITMSLVISEDIVQASGLSEKELVLELIILLFQRKKLVLVKRLN